MKRRFVHTLVIALTLVTVVTTDQELEANSTAEPVNAIYVDDDAPNDPGPGDISTSDPREDGTDGYPFDSIQEALRVAGNGVTIVVREGIYKERVDLLGKSVTVIGSWLVESNGTAEPPVVDGGGVGPVLTLSSKGEADCVVEGLRIRGGKAASGAAILCHGSSPRILHCVICGNVAAGSRGSIIECQNSGAAFVSCTISGNVVPADGGLFCCADSEAVVSNSIFWQNATDVGGNSIVPTAIMVRSGNGPMVSYTDVQGGWPGVGNTNLDPTFIALGRWTSSGVPDSASTLWVDGNYHLQSRSPCIDAGDPAADWRREPTPNGSRIDMGAYGGTSQASRSYAEPPVTLSVVEEEAEALMQRVSGGDLTVEPATAILVHDPSGTPAYYIVPGLSSSTGGAEMFCGIDAQQGVWQWHSETSDYEGQFPPVSAQLAAELLAGLLEDHAIPGRLESPLCVSAPNYELYWQFLIIDSTQVQTAYVSLFDGSMVYDPGNILTGLDIRELRLNAPPLNMGGSLPTSHRVGTTQARSLSAFGTNGESLFALAAGEIPAAYAIDVPYHVQETSWYCGEAALQMVFDYYGPLISQADIGDVANESSSYGTYKTDLMRAVNFSDMSKAIQNSSLVGYKERPVGYVCWYNSSSQSWLSLIKAAIAQGYPVIVLQWYDASKRSGHYRVVKGYDDTNQELTVQDPWYSGILKGPDLKFSYTTFESLWSYTYWACVAVPWELTIVSPKTVCPESSFNTDASARNPCPTDICGWSTYAIANSQMKITLPAGCSLQSGENQTKSISIGTGNPTTVNWKCISASAPIVDKIIVEACGIITGNYGGTVGSFTDRIGSTAFALVTTTVPVLRAETSGVSNVKGTSATLNGTLVDDGGVPCKCGFRYGLAHQDPGEWIPVWCSDEEGFPRIFRTGDTFSADVDALTPGNEYGFHAMASPIGGCEEGGVIGETPRFNTPIVWCPTVRTDSAVLVGRTVTVYGTLLDDGAEACEVRFCARFRGPAWSMTTCSPWTGWYVSGESFSYSFDIDPSVYPHVMQAFYHAEAQNSACPAEGEEKEIPDVIVMNAPPILDTIGDKAIDQGQLLTFTISATDADGDDLTYSAFGLPSGATFVGRTFAWTPGSSQVGNHTVVFSASDGEAEDAETIVIQVTNVNRPPVLQPIGDKSTWEGEPLGFTLSAIDEDGDNLTYSAFGLPSGATLDGPVFTWTPGSGQAGDYLMMFTVSDGKDSDSESVEIIVRPGAPSSIDYPESSTTGVYTVIWSASSGATSYHLERRPAFGIPEWWPVYDGPSTSHVENIGNGSWLYRVCASSPAGSSPWRTGDHSCVVSVVVPPAVQTRPAQLSGRHVVFWGRLLDDGGEPCQGRFRITMRWGWLPENTWSYATPWQGAYYSGEDFSATVDVPDRVPPGEVIEVSYCAEAKNDAGPGYGNPIYGSVRFPP